MINIPQDIRYSTKKFLFTESSGKKYKARILCTAHFTKSKFPSLYTFTIIHQRKAGGCQLKRSKKHG